MTRSQSSPLWDAGAHRPGLPPVRALRPVNKSAHQKVAGCLNALGGCQQPALVQDPGAREAGEQYDLLQLLKE